MVTLSYAATTVSNCFGLYSYVLTLWQSRISLLIRLELVVESKPKYDFRT
jgi:hypothetical protein